METTKFDAVARLFATERTRRQTLRGLLAGAAAVTVGTAGRESAQAGAGAEAKQRCKRAGAPCTSNKQCCPDKTKRICDVPFGSGNSDEFCCGGLGAKCGGADENGDAVGLKCCQSFSCSTGDIDAPDFEPNTPGVCGKSGNV